MKDLKRLPYTRQQKILEQLNRLEQHECLKIDDLARDFHVSNMTIYRDIEQLEKSGDALRVHGGVRPAEKDLPVFPEEKGPSSPGSPGILPAYRDSTIEERFRREIESKNAIAEIAAGYVQDGDVIAIDPSTTTLCMCSCLMDRDITVVTTSINVVLQFASSKTVSVILCGGSIRKSALSVVGPLVEDVVNRVRISKCFVSSHAFAYEQGLTDMTMEECEAKRQLMRRCKEVYVLLDHTKINQYAPFVVCTPGDINVLITDSKAGQNPEKRAILQKCADDGVKVVYAAEQQEEMRRPG